MKIAKCWRLFVGLAATLILFLPVLGLAAAPVPLEPASTGTPAAVPPPAGAASDEVNDLVLQFHPATPGIAPAKQPRLAQAYGRLPLSFEANQGQTDSQVKFLSRGRGYTLFLTSTEAVLAFTRTVVRMKLVGANPAPEVAGLAELPGKTNYFIGNDPAKWRTNVPTYARVEYRGVYPGVSLVYYGNQRQLEYDFVVAPGADPTRIRLAFQGADKLTVDLGGNLVLSTAAGEVVQRAPLVYQEVNGARREIAGRYVLQGKDWVGFRVAAYDRSRPLVIDPVLDYATYLGGSGFEKGTGIAVESSSPGCTPTLTSTGGCAYVTGRTTSANFPVTDTSALGGAFDAFVTKLNADGSALLYSTYLGGDRAGGEDDVGSAIAVDAAGNAYVTGRTRNTNFPTTTTTSTTTAAYQLTCTPAPPSPPAPTPTAPCSDAFVVKLNDTGSALLYSTYLGGSGDDQGLGIAVDTSGNAYVTRSTKAPYALDSSNESYCRLNPCGAFVAKIDPSQAGAASLVYSTYLAGATGNAIAVDADGNAYVTGGAGSTFLTTPNAYQEVYGGGDQDAFVAKLDTSGSLVYSTYLGGQFSDSGNGIAVDAFGHAYVAGETSSTQTSSPPFPTTAGAFQTGYGGANQDAFVAKLNATGSALVYSTYLGGVGNDRAFGIAVDAFRNAYVTGVTGHDVSGSANFPTQNPLQAFGGGDSDAFVAKLTPFGSALFYSTYLGGSGGDSGAAIAVDAQGNAYVTGNTTSVTSVSTTGAYQPAYGEGTDAFVAKLSVAVLPVAIDIKPGNSQNVINLGGGNVSVAILSTVGFDATTVDLSTVTLAGAPVALAGNGRPKTSVRDVNGDGLPDLVLDFEIRALGLSSTDTEAVLEGTMMMPDGRMIRGTDFIRIVP